MITWINKKINQLLHFLYDDVEDDEVEYKFDDECCFCEIELEEDEIDICDDCANEIG